MCFEITYLMAVLKLHTLQEITVRSLKKIEGQKQKTDKDKGRKTDRKTDRHTNITGGKSSKQKRRSVKGLPDVFYASILQSQG